MYFIKKLLFVIFILSLGFVMPVKADVMPYYVNNISTDSIGVYQASKNIRIHKEPNENSTLLLNASWDSNTFNCSQISASNLFLVFLPKRELAFLTVIDENDGEDWVKVIYDKAGSKTGWIKKEDEFKFMNWRTFFNLYGRKYGLYYMKDAPEDSKVIYGSAADDAQSIGRITLAQTVKVTSVSGIWVLVISYDIDKSQKIGWIKWRNISGEIYLFPNIR